MIFSWFPVKTNFSVTASLLLAFLLFSPVALALTGQLNVNTATLEELQQLPFVGETRARAIIDYRHKQGGFRTLEELRASETIGASTFKAIKPYLVLTGPSTLRLEQARAEPTGNLETRLQIFATAPGEIVLLPDALYYETLLHYLGQAKHQIDLSMFIFKITGSPGNRPAHVMRALTAASKRGVEVNVLLERSERYEDLSRENQRVAENMRRQGVRVTLADQQRTNHTKLVVIDRRFSFVGSHNLTHAALAHNNELSLLIDNRELARELLDYINDMKNPRTEQ